MIDDVGYRIETFDGKRWPGMDAGPFAVQWDAITRAKRMADSDHVRVYRVVNERGAVLFQTLQDDL